MYTVILSPKARKHKKLLARANLEAKAKRLLAVLTENPYRTPPPYEKLLGDFEGAYSRRINRQHRLIYQIDEASKRVFVLSMWTHYEA